MSGYALEAEIRRFAKQALGSAEKVLRMTGLESLAITQVEPLGYEISRSGRRFFGGIQATAAGRAPTISMPTTAAQWMLWNGESDNGLIYALDFVTILQISGTAAAGGVILAALTNTKIAAPTAAASYATSSASKTATGTKAIWADAQTLATAPVWMALKGNGNPATTTNGGDTAQLDGKLLIPPGYAAAFHYLSGVGTSPLYGVSAMWAELEGDIE